MTFSLTFSFRGKVYHLKLQRFNKPIAPTEGMASKIPGTHDHVIFLDYDNVVDEELKNDLEDLQDIFELGDFHVFATSPYGRHVVCLDRMSMREAYTVVMESGCDNNFKQGIRINEYRTWILRVLEKGDRPKPKYLYTIKSRFDGQRLQSQAHGLFLERYYGAQ